jgi:phospholipase/lecithinase/hemolysin
MTIHGEDALRNLLFIGVVWLSLTLVWPAASQTCSGIVAFGDSLSDNGPDDGYGLRVSSNGRVWVVYLAERMGAALLDMAYTSAQTNYHPVTDSTRWGFRWQIEEYLRINGTASADTLYTIWIGGNDLLMRQGAPERKMATAIANILAGMDRLIDAGADHILVMNMPDLGLTPLMNGHNLHMNGPDQRRKFVDDANGGTRLSSSFNKALHNGLAPYRKLVRLYEVDVFALMNRFVDQGVFDNATHMLMANQPTVKSHMFWDTHHPTDDAHRLIAEAVYQKVITVFKPTALSPCRSLVNGAGPIANRGHQGNASRRRSSLKNSIGIADCHLCQLFDIRILSLL